MGIRWLLDVWAYRLSQIVTGAFLVAAIGHGIRGDWLAVGLWVGLAVVVDRSVRRVLARRR